MKNCITDIHMHVAPAVDDGSRTIDESCEMLRLAVEQGVGAVFATPHDSAFLCTDVRAVFGQLKEAVRQREIPVELYLGCELRISTETAERCVQGLIDGTYPTMGNSRCVLSEFTFGTSLQDSLFCIRTLTQHGFVPIIAHIERFPDIDLRFANALRDAGALIQINACSIAEERNDKIRQRANLFLKERIVDFIGTDAHRTDHRPPLFHRGLDELKRKYTEEYSALIAVDNPRKYLTDFAASANGVYSQPSRYVPRHFPSR